MKRWTASLVLLMMAMATGGVGLFVSSSPVILVAYMSADASPPLLKWSAEQALFGFHPTEEEIRQLNAEAGARYAALYPEESRARRLLEHFLENGINVNAIDTVTGSGVSALHSAVLDRNPFAVGLLLENGANPDIEGQQGRTPLDFAKLLQAKNPGPDIAAIVSVLKTDRYSKSQTGPTWK